MILIKAGALGTAPKDFRNETAEAGYQRKNRNHLDQSTIPITLNTQKSPGDLRRLNPAPYPPRYVSLPDNSILILGTYKPDVSIKSWDTLIHYHIRCFCTQAHIAILSSRLFDYWFVKCIHLYIWSTQQVTVAQHARRFF